MLQRSYRSKIRQVSWQRCCRWTCQVLECLEKSKHESLGFMILRQEVQNPCGNCLQIGPRWRGLTDPDIIRYIPLSYVQPQSRQYRISNSCVKLSNIHKILWIRCCRNAHFNTFYAHFAQRVSIKLYTDLFVSGKATGSGQEVAIIIVWVRPVYIYCKLRSDFKFCVFNSLWRWIIIGCLLVDAFKWVLCSENRYIEMTIHRSYLNHKSRFNILSSHEHNFKVTSSRRLPHLGNVWCKETGDIRAQSFKLGMNWDFCVHNKVYFLQSSSFLSNGFYCL